jgi:hypothetical protein
MAGEIGDDEEEGGWRGFINSVFVGVSDRKWKLQSPQN